MSSVLGMPVILSVFDQFRVSSRVQPNCRIWTLTCICGCRIEHRLSPVLVNSCHDRMLSGGIASEEIELTSLAILRTACRASRIPCVAKHSRFFAWTWSNRCVLCSFWSSRDHLSSLLCHLLETRQHGDASKARILLKKMHLQFFFLEVDNSSVSAAKYTLNEVMNNYICKNKIIFREICVSVM